MNADILKYVVEHGMIDLAYVQEQIEMTKRETILQAHLFSIWQGTNGKWYTYLPKEGGGRILKKRTTEEAIKDLIIAFYTEKGKTDNKEKRAKEKQAEIEQYRFDFCFQYWKDRQATYGRKTNTIKKYESDYDRIFKGSDFEKMDIRDVTEEDITIFMISKIKELQLKEKAGKALWGYISGVFSCAKTKRKISDNPCDYVDRKVFAKFYCREEKPVSQKIVSNQELDKLLKAIKEVQQERPDYICIYAIELAAYTGMRVGEIAALTWADVDFVEQLLYISKSEKYDRGTGQYYIDTTKNDKSRVFPLSQKLVDFFTNLKNVQLEHGISGEYIFTNADGKIHTRTMCSCMQKQCSRAGIGQKGIHALRKTLNSKIRCEGVSATVAAALLGHTEEVNEKNYTFDISEMDYKRAIIEKVTA